MPPPPHIAMPRRKYLGNISSPPLARFRANVRGGAAPLAEDDALRIPPFALHPVLAPDFRRSTLEQITNVAIAVQGELHRPVAPEATAVPIDKALKHPFNFCKVFVLAPFARQVKNHMHVFAMVELALLTRPDGGERDIAARERLVQAFAHMGEPLAGCIGESVGAIPHDGAMGVQGKANFPGVYGRLDNAVSLAR